jgi:hypothetical protein
MPAEIGPQITQITRINSHKKAQKDPQITPQRNSPDQSGIPQGKQNDFKYVAPTGISSSRADTEHKVLYCEASFE